LRLVTGWCEPPSTLRPVGPHCAPQHIASSGHLAACLSTLRPLAFRRVSVHCVLSPVSVALLRHWQKIGYTSRFVRVILAQGPC